MIKTLIIVIMEELEIGTIVAVIKLAHKRNSMENKKTKLT